MLNKKALSAVLLILGMGIFIFGSYMSSEAMQDNNRLAQAKENEQEHRRPVIGPVRKGIRANSAETAQEKISEAGQKVAKSQVTADWLQGTGIVLFITGVSCLIFFSSSKKRNG